jgi:hypothetical protein
MNLTSTPGVAEFDAAWSPDGDALAFATHTDASGDANIARSSLDPWAPVPVVASSASELGPDWHRLPASTSLCSPAADPGTEGPCRLGVEEALEGDADVPLDSAPEMDEGGDSARTTSVAVAPGITYRRIRDRRRRQRIFVLTINMSAGPRIGTALARETLPDFERTTTMAKGNGAFAAVNGDFGLPSGRPAHDFAAEGDLKQTSRAYGYHFGPAADGSKASTGHRVVTLESVVARGERWFASRWNDGAPTVGQIAAFSPVARSLERAPAFACSVRVSSALTRDWAAGKQGVESEHTVVAGGCDATSRQAAGGIVLSARAFSEEASFLRGLVLGDSITLRWSIGWDGVSDTLGGYPQLVRNGRILVGNCSQSLCRRHPRTGVGIRSDGRILLVVVDGRRKQARGMTLRAFARRLKKLGAVRALNLDGGGSSTMWIRGKGIVNRPSDGRERYVSSALLVYKTADQNLARSPAASGPGPIPAERTPASAGRIVVEDPASTGGFLDALESGVLTAPVELPADLLKVVRRFRAANRAFG